MMRPAVELRISVRSYKPQMSARCLADRQANDMLCTDLHPGFCTPDASVRLQPAVLALQRMLPRPPHAPRRLFGHARSHKFVTEQLIDARLLELHPSILHDARDNHQIKMGSEQD